jgi:phage tail sheath protein FI
VPVQPTYPGVYIEEVPSAVHTIVGVSTSVTAFIGYTARGPVNRPIRILSYGDYQRAFGDLDSSSPVSYAVQQFFQNGGIEAYVVRVAASAAAADVDLRDKITGGQTVLTATAASPGIWGNNVFLTVDYGAGNPLDQFNLTVVEYREQNGALVVGATETFPNLSMNSRAPNYAVDTVNANSFIVQLSRPAALASTETAQALSRVIDEDAIDYVKVGPGKELANVVLSVDGNAPRTLSLAAPTGADNLARLTSIANDIKAKAGLAGITNLANPSVTGSAHKRQLSFATSNSGEERSIRFSSAAQNDAAAVLGLGLANGGQEFDGSRSLRPMESGTVGTDQSALDLTTLTANQTADVKVDRAVRPDTTITGLVFWTSGDGPPATLEVLRARVEASLRAAAGTNPDAAAELAQARVLLIRNRIQLIADGPGDSVLSLSTGLAATLGINVSARTNVSRYRLGVGPALGAQSNASPGSDGTVPSAGDIRGSELAKTGLYALQDVDLFNILCLPAQSDNLLLAEAMSYCERRRAFLIVDVPGSVDALDKATDWVNAPSTPKSKNSAAYFPWVTMPDPLQQYRPARFPPSGMLAGLYARTDGTRGVWKAPAGTEATLRGPQGLTYLLTDGENGVINPLGLNAIRALRTYGIVAWGARTLEGADQKTSEWKYIPVRRLALYIEESLYRGTQWVVFEPNDEPLWSQIRLNVGAFMHNLFRQGAFQGASPRDAYLVKCDKETTTQADIDLGIVNILVGFAPLKPAEFVILKISQLAGQVEA